MDAKQVSCYGCGVKLDMTKVAPGSRHGVGLPGKHCPVCDAPLDGRALANHDPQVAHAGDSIAAKVTIRKRVQDFHAEHGLVYAEPALNRGPAAQSNPADAAAIEAAVAAAMRAHAAHVEELAQSIAEKVIAKALAEKSAPADSPA